MASYFFELSYTLVVIFLVGYFLLRSLRAPFSKKQHILHWIFFGFVINFYGLSWLYAVYPLSWMKEGAVQLVGIGLLHLILSVVTSLPYGVIALHTHKKITQHLLPFVFASLLVVAEFFRSLIIATMYKGEGTTITLHFTAGTIGNALSSTPFIEYAYFGGTFALTFVLGYLVYTLSSRGHLTQYRFHSIALILILIGIHFLAPTMSPEKETVVGIVTTNFPQTTSEDEESFKKAFREQSSFLHAATLSFGTSSKNTPSFIVYPEDTRYIPLLSEKETDDLQKYFPNTLFIDGAVFPLQKGLSNVSIFYSPKKEEIPARGKELLLPFNEYIPYFFKYITLFFIPKGKIDSYEKLHTFTPVYSDKTITSGDMRIGTLICSEILSYSVIQRLVKEKPSIVFFQSRLHVFHDSPWFVMHLRSFTKVAAAQLRTPVISSTSGAPSFIVSPYGYVEKVLPTGFSTSTYTFK